MLSQFSAIPPVIDADYPAASQRPQQQPQQWAVGSIPLTAGLPPDWLAQIPRQADQPTPALQQQLPPVASSAERDSSGSQSTPTSMMDELRDLNMTDLAMTDLMGTSGYDRLWEPYLANSPVGDGRLVGGESQGDWDSKAADGDISRRASTSMHQPARFFPSTFRPKSKDCFSQARINLQQLEQTLKSQEQWGTSWAPTNQSTRVRAQTSAEPITDSTRDQLLVVTQLLLQQSRSIHVRNSSSIHTDAHPLNAVLITLPPTKVLDDMIRAYSSNFDQYFKLYSSPVLKPNDLLAQLPQHGKLPGIVLLLMIAIGAAALPTQECQNFAVGLAEMCRISLSELLERDFSITTEPMVSSCALLLLYLGMWCGERWLMGISSAQKAMYVHLFRNATHLETPDTHQPFFGALDVDQAWSKWKDQEFKSRLTYAWVMADQEWSLFYDTANIFSVDMLIDPMPADDKLWKAASSTDWAQLVPEYLSNTSQISLRDLYSRFMNGELRVVRGPGLSLLSLRLLLMPLQGMVCHLRQWLQTFSNRPVRWKRSAQALSNSAIHAQLDQVRGLLIEWFTLASHSSSSPSTDSPFSLATLVIYHLVSLNTISGFPEIEDALANGMMPDRGSWNPAVGGVQGPDVSVVAQDSEEEVLFHCGQVLRLYRLMPQKEQPLWWPGVIYRVALIVCFIAIARHPFDWQQPRSSRATSWTTGSGDKDNSRTSTTTNGNAGGDILSTSASSYTLESAMASSSGNQLQFNRRFALDGLPADHPTLVNFLKYKDGEPTLTYRDGHFASLKNPDEIFRYFIEMLDGGRDKTDHGMGSQNLSGTQLQSSVRSALESVADRWGIHGR
ncbi:hypothetical protein BGW36DRAFT_307906 [Talaromyces proteolyticus]|uniref:Xylanolytic transcriptional activator regulatory domain-containing protein n=1 Tax=Talaromyces proteolyticus TaxID=1131652 RepID=A0AAD4PUG4_9EURO|nr:uncharacterized protein BGW36DRAFT_307906 [Talaromyces proteolyticus]KAH8689372.1 hypothetical protein BGW36DRAFT_307906 [Talaromyces proteolyticus]